ncbi:unnamed protein product [Urochloa humidicola]
MMNYTVSILLAFAVTIQYCTARSKIQWRKLVCRNCCFISADLCRVHHHTDSGRLCSSGINTGVRLPSVYGSNHGHTLSDGTITTISKDRVKPSPRPDRWKLNEIFATGIVMGTYLAMVTVLFYWALTRTTFFESHFKVRSLKEDVSKISPGFDLCHT